MTDLALREDQVVRYSRQILLPRVGGHGQERLLATGVQVSGSAQAVAVAAAYLAAGGTPVRAETLSAQGFLSPDTAAADLNPDAAQDAAEWGQLAGPEARFSASGPWVALMQDALGVAFCLARTRAGCGDCFRQNLSTRREPGEGAPATLLGSWGAMAFQRAVLGWEKADLRLWRLDRSGLASEAGVERCAGCRA